MAHALDAYGLIVDADAMLGVPGIPCVSIFLAVFNDDLAQVGQVILRE